MMGKQTISNLRPKRLLLIWGGFDLLLLAGGFGYILQTQTVLRNQITPARTELTPKRSPQTEPAFSSGSTPTATPLILPTATPTPGSSSVILATASPPSIPSTSPFVADNQIVIGYSVAGRPLVVYQFGDGPLQRMIVAGIHGGNEYNTILLANKLIHYLNKRPEKIPKEVTLYILPALNPDGEARSHNIYGRANENGVDLNHNFPVAWQADWSRDGCWHYLKLSGGDRPASEPEAIALMGFLLSHKVEALISYHSAALGIFPGGDPPDPTSQRLAEAVAAVSAYPYPPIATGCEMTGSLADWAAAQNIAALDVELTNHTDPDFKQNLQILRVLLDWRR
jgi:predicted deacylase